MRSFLANSRAARPRSLSSDFRLGNPTLKTLNKAWTWDRVLETLESMKLTHFIRVKTEVDKDALKTKANPAQLAAVGCRIDQDETFFVEPKDTATKAA